MKWNYALGACVLVVVYAVFAHAPIPAMLGGIALVTTLKLASIQLLRRFEGKRSRDTNA
jgi:hypothetical protein